MSGMKNTAQKVTKATSKVLYGPLAKYAPEVKMHKKVSDKLAKNLSSPKEAPTPPPPLYGGIYQTGMPSLWRKNGKNAWEGPTGPAPGAWRLSPEQIDAALSARNILAQPYSGPVPLSQQGGATPGSFLARLAALQANQGQGR